MTSSADPQNEGLETAPACLFCGNDTSDHAIEGVRDHFFSCDTGSFTLQRCSNCGSLWLPQRPFGQRLQNAYSEYYTHTTPAESQSASLKGWMKRAYIQDRFGGRAGLLDRLGSGLYKIFSPDPGQTDAYLRFSPKAPSRVLDFGCGNGEYLLRAKALGHEVTGVDFDEKALAQLRPKGISAFALEDIDDAEWCGRFDHVSLSHVVEHVPDPIALLAKLYRWTAPSGSLFLEVPNSKSIGLSIFNQYWRGLEAPRHFSLPSPEGLARALNEAGYTIEKRIIRQGVRDWVWKDSLAVVPESERTSKVELMQKAPAENFENAEFLTYLCLR